MMFENRVGLPENPVEAAQFTRSGMRQVVFDHFQVSKGPVDFFLAVAGSWEVNYPSSKPWLTATQNGFVNTREYLSAERGFAGRLGSMMGLNIPGVMSKDALLKVLLGNHLILSIEMMIGQFYVEDYLASENMVWDGRSLSVHKTLKNNIEESGLQPKEASTVDACVFYGTGTLEMQSALVASEFLSYLKSSPSAKLPLLRRVKACLFSSLTNRGSGRYYPDSGIAEVGCRVDNDWIRVGTTQRAEGQEETDGEHKFRISFYNDIFPEILWTVIHESRHSMQGDIFSLLGELDAEYYTWSIIFGASKMFTGGKFYGLGNGLARRIMERLNDVIFSMQDSDPKRCLAVDHNIGIREKENERRIAAVR